MIFRWSGAVGQEVVQLFGLFPPMFKVEYKYSACVKICTDDLTILCDPWFSERTYHGAWCQHPRTRNWEESIGDFDAIYVSHIHPDHYCPWTIKRLFNVYGEKKIFIAEWGDQVNYLARKMASDGLDEMVVPARKESIGNTSFYIVPKKTRSLSDIDSSLLVYTEHNRSAVLNVNDCTYSAEYCTAINEIISDEALDVRLFCLGYTGAGPYPQTYYSPLVEEKKLIALASKKKQDLFKRYLKFTDKIASAHRLPFAGKYALCGKLSILNKYRGVADAVEVRKFDDGAIVLEDGGNSYFDIETMVASSERDVEYKDFYEAEIHDMQFEWDAWFSFSPSNSVLVRLLRQSVLRAHKKSECGIHGMYSIYAMEDEDSLMGFWEKEDPCLFYSPLLTFNCNASCDPFEIPSDIDIHSHVFISRKALFAVLTGLTHWNNYEVGSIFQVRRKPDVFNQSMQDYLHFCTAV